MAVVPVTGIRMPLEIREKVDHVKEERGLGSRSEAMLFLIGLALAALPYLLSPDAIKKATRKAERAASIPRRKGRPGAKKA